MWLWRWPARWWRIHPERSEVIVYGGAIHLSKDFRLEGDRRMYGAVCLPDERRSLGRAAGRSLGFGSSQEHGILHLAAEDLARMHVGDLVCILPAHSCLTVTLMKRYLTLNGRVIETMNEYPLPSIRGASPGWLADDRIGGTFAARDRLVGHDPAVWPGGPAAGTTRLCWLPGRRIRVQ